MVSLRPTVLSSALSHIFEPPRSVRSVTPWAVNLAAVCVAGALFLRERRTAGKLARLGGATFEALLSAIDANDPMTGAHMRRVARYALILADAADLDERVCHEVERVALFHDIGKIHEALFDVIHDRRQLTPEERRAIKTHPRRGAEVLTPLAAFYPDLPAGVLAHHERWDGTGYPRGLRGTRIPLAARIVAIADTFDAVTRRRRYRPPLGLGTAREILLEGRGTQFDPTLVDLFLMPPVFERVTAAMHNREDNGEHKGGHTGEREARSRRPGRPSQHRRGHRTGSKRVGAPDIKFRWRGTAPSPQRPGPATRRSR